ncbi:biotin--[acetyl-CoA-carboxylase] ligase [Zongyangia hominis]|uniref:biotin--[biotin carboxyl-carrier protein] ligase n=1 Tax=Zongyangia hominis TaxID=2763677 RepID=A0A926EB96_9FIRM|nr:biotin--[acetyl-CoA-carboxylase] ligase [Zongyangia hominis]MBC8571355.1 biotin--[acetyl-CoA-carboxylase] ligase [Zongyangia hominis]
MELQNLTTQVLGQNCIYLDEVDSTNDYLKREGERLPHGTVVIAERQVAGKGRLGRQWAPTDREALAMSLLLRPFLLKQMAALPLVCGMAVARALEGLTKESFGIKWTNDVVTGGKKVCGILCESRVMAGESWAVCGMGVNLVQTEEDFAARDLPYATSVAAATGVKVEPFAVAARILNELEPLCERFAAAGFGALREEYGRQCVTLGRQVRVTDGGRTLEGTALDVGEDGNLILHVDGKVVHIAAGEASVRGMYGYI